MALFPEWPCTILAALALFAATPLAQTDTNEFDELAKESVFSVSNLSRLPFELSNTWRFISRAIRSVPGAGQDWGETAQFIFCSSPSPWSKWLVWGAGPFPYAIHNDPAVSPPNALHSIGEAFGREQHRTPEQALPAYSRNAAIVLGIEDQVRILASGEFAGLGG